MDSEFAKRLTELAHTDRLRQLIPRRIDGVRLIEPDGQELLNFGGNDYLGLANDLGFNRGVAAELPSGSGASALVCGWSDLHQQLSTRIAEFESAASAVLFPSGYAACSGTIATLAEAGDLILSDQLNHASLIDGCRLSTAKCVVYPHRDLEFVEQVLVQSRGQYKRVWIVTDGVFSMDGHIAPLASLCDIAQRFDAHMVVDEAHGTGVLGSNGKGVCEALGVKDLVAVRIGTLSKAVGSQGGFVVGSKVLTDYLVNRCRTLIFSTALAPMAVKAALQAFEIMEQQPERRAKVCALAKHLRQQLSQKCSDPTEAEVPIIPVVVGSDQAAVTVSRALANEGFYVPAIRPPTVPEGTARLRISLSAAHDEAMVDRLSHQILRLTR